MKGKKFLFPNCTVCNGELYFVEVFSGLLTKMNPDNGKCVYLNAIEDFVDNSYDTADFIKSYKNQIYILEMSGKNLIIYDLINMKSNYIKLNCGYEKWGNFVAFERYESDFYIFLRHEKRIIRFNTETAQVTETEVYLNGSNKVHCCCRIEDDVFMLPFNGSVINVYNLRHNEITCWELDEVLENCVDAAYGNGSIYILNHFGVIYKWELYSKRVEKIKTLETEHVEEETMGKLVYTHNKLFVFPALGQDIKILDTLTRRGEIYCDYPKDFIYSDIEVWGKYLGLCEDKQFYYFAMRMGNYLLKICKSDGSMIWIKPQQPSETDEMKIYFDMGKTMFRETKISLSGFINTSLDINNKSTEKNCGKIIYERIMM